MQPAVKLLKKTPENAFLLKKRIPGVLIFK
jgi:hypothetical protein